MEKKTARFKGSPLSNLVNNLSEGIHKIKCKYGHDHKKLETCWITYKICDCFLEYTNFKDDLIDLMFNMKGLIDLKWFNVYVVRKFINKSLIKN